MRTLPVLIRPAAAILFAIAAASPLSAQTERRTISGDRVSIYNLAGRLRVQATTGSDVVVEITRGGRDASRLSFLTGDVHGFQSLRVSYPSDRIVYPNGGRRTRTQLRVNDDGTFDDRDDGRTWGSRRRVEIRDDGSGLEAHADLVVGVPKGQRLVVHWGVGEATISNVDGDLTVSTAAARITAEHTRGSLVLDAGSGNLTLTDAQGNVTLDTGSGGVTANGVRGESLDIDTGSGSVQVSNVDVKTLKGDVGSGGLRLDQIRSPRVALDAGSGGVEVRLLSVVEDLTIDAGSGSVTVQLQPAQGAEVDIETGSGGIETDFAVRTTRLERNHLRGRIGDGRGRIRIESGSGRVRLIKS